MRILSISAQKPDSTGSGIYLSETVRGFNELGHQTAVVAGIDKDDRPDIADEMVFFPVRFRTEGLPFPVCGMSDTMPYEATRYRDMTARQLELFYAAFGRVISHAIETFAPDLIVCHHLYLVTALTTRLKPPCPVWGVCHSTDLRQMRTHGLEHDAVCEGVRALDGVFALHDAQARDIEAVYGVRPEKVFVVGAGFNDRIFSVGGPCAPDDGSGRRHVAYAGKIWFKKGVFQLIDCMTHVEGAEGLVLDLAGGSDSSDDLAEAKRRANTVPCQVDFLGRLSQSDLAKVYRRADVFVLPSFFEGLPLVVIEALACGCHVVVTDLPGIADWISRALPEAPVAYVRPPAMRGVDEPVAGDLPAFERRLARAIEAALSAASRDGRVHVDARALSWKGLALRMVAQAATR